MSREDYALHIELPKQNLDMPTNPRQDIQTVPAFTIKDSGKRQDFDSGMVRDVTDGKINWCLIFDGPMLKRWAQHLTTGAQKYAKRNWMKAQGEVELERARESAFRHFMQWFDGDRDEDHASAIFFNVNQCEFIREKMQRAGASKNDT